MGAKCPLVLAAMWTATIAAGLLRALALRFSISGDGNSYLDVAIACKAVTHAPVARKAFTALTARTFPIKLRVGVDMSKFMSRGQSAGARDGRERMMT
jgi:hypothetical protein